MKKKSINHYVKIFLVCLATAVAVAGPVYSKSEKVILVGEINDTQQLVAEGEIYDIEPTALGEDLIQNYISIKVEVECTLRQGEELKSITVISFHTVEE
jgi:hypothetical protein